MMNIENILSDENRKKRIKNDSHTGVNDGYRPARKLENIIRGKVVS